MSDDIVRYNSGDAIFVTGVFAMITILVVLFAGEPDLLETIVAWIGRH